VTIRILILACIPFLTAAVDPLPSSYEGIVLLQSTLDDVESKFGPANLFEIPFGHHDYGYCYKAKSGIAAVFSSSSEGYYGIITGLEIRNTTAGYTCTETDIDLPACIGHFCLGSSQAEIEASIGVPLTETNTGQGSKVAMFGNDRELSQDEQKALNLGSGTYSAYVSNNIWAIFDTSGAFALGILKFAEDVHRTDD